VQRINLIAIRGVIRGLESLDESLSSVDAGDRTGGPLRSRDEVLRSGPDQVFEVEPVVPR
jgi:hypothetical protein